jgi:ribonuclease Y
MPRMCCSTRWRWDSCAASWLPNSGLKEKLAKRMGLLHDIGKAIDHEVEGPHAVIGSKLARNSVSRPQCRACHRAAHHEDVRPNQRSTPCWCRRPTAFPVPGPVPARSCWKIISSASKTRKPSPMVSRALPTLTRFRPVRELRVIVKSDKVHFKDEDSPCLLSRDIAKKIEESLTFPGQIKVTVIRETRRWNTPINSARPRG